MAKGQYGQKQSIDDRLNSRLVMVDSYRTLKAAIKRAIASSQRDLYNLEAAAEKFFEGRDRSLAARIEALTPKYLPKPQSPQVPVPPTKPTRGKPVSYVDLAKQYVAGLLNDVQEGNEIPAELFKTFVVAHTNRRYSHGGAIRAMAAVGFDYLKEKTAYVKRAS